MLYSIALALLVLWAVGLATGFTMGGLIHGLLIVAVAVAVVTFIGGRRAL